ncbi:glucuronyl hydrolase [Parapedobacter pyrenivorans]|uniref:Glucuronyl hydrolase n=1 Tax=Parapedobacter pyrenivorans TaxID=1305674 RepID=A0A917HDW2_9SPHI|nr:glycoside hydrolase family 88 protein [Parapedobacter pyrenivorans]GGG75249.1 glucuronyl hydrolase [Parapedobacter pyrenivorans]
MKTLLWKVLATTATTLLANAGSPDNRTDTSVLDETYIERELSAAAEQIKTLIRATPPDSFPTTFEHGKPFFSDSRSWTSGFYPGTLWYLYEYTDDTELKEEGRRKLGVLEKEKNNRSTHDLGFMLYCSFGNAWRIAKKPHDAEVLMAGANALASRFNETVGCIRSWDFGQNRWQFPVIIDNMMNLELLNWASRMSGEERYQELSKSHADKTLANHFRPDHSTYHVVDYDTVSGEAVQHLTYQGIADESAWARGQSWALYGYTMMFRDTRDSVYLDQAVKVATYLLEHPGLPDDLIPYWDFDLAGTPGTCRDVSAAALNASALIELSAFVDAGRRARYMNTAEAILFNLGKAPYRAKPGEAGGFLLKHSVGNFPGGTEIDVPLSYADYYYVEALIRFGQTMGFLTTNE